MFFKRSGFSGKIFRVETGNFEKQGARRASGRSGAYADDRRPRAADFADPQKGRTTERGDGLPAALPPRHLHRRRSGKPRNEARAGMDPGAGGTVEDRICRTAFCVDGRTVSGSCTVFGQAREDTGRGKMVEMKIFCTFVVRNLPTFSESRKQRSNLFELCRGEGTCMKMNLLDKPGAAPNPRRRSAEAGKHARN